MSTAPSSGLRSRTTGAAMSSLLTRRTPARAPPTISTILDPVVLPLSKQTATHRPRRTLATLLPCLPSPQCGRWAQVCRDPSTADPSVTAPPLFALSLSPGVLGLAAIAWQIASHSPWCRARRGHRWLAQRHLWHHLRACHQVHSGTSCPDLADRKPAGVDRLG